MENEVFDIIISLVKSYDDASDLKHPYVKSSYSNREYVIHNANYILNQVLRQISIPEDHYLLSKGANDLWNKLKPDGKCGKNIKDYWYRETLTVHPEAFSKEYGEITIKDFNESHNRYLIIDSSEVYDLGTSVNRMGGKIFTMNKEELKEVRDVLIKLFN